MMHFYKLFLVSLILLQGKVYAAESNNSVDTISRFPNFEFKIVEEIRAKPFSEHNQYEASEIKKVLGNKHTQSQISNLWIALVDLNGDSRKDIFLFDTLDGQCASAGCVTKLYISDNEGNYERIKYFSDEGVSLSELRGTYALESKTNEFKDLLLVSKQFYTNSSTGETGTVKSHYIIKSFNGEFYKTSGSINFNYQKALQKDN